MIQAIAIDDEPRALEVIRNHALGIPNLTLREVFTDPLRAMAYIQDHPVDLIFLDINMPGLDGLSLVKGFSLQQMIIFTTAHSEYALAGFEVEAVDYLLKPFDRVRFLQAVNKARNRMKPDGAGMTDFFFVNTGNQQRRISYSDILYVHAEGNYITYFTPTEKIWVRSTMAEALKFLPVPMFVQIHRSYIVAVRNIEKIEDNHVYIRGTAISIGNTFRENFLRVIDSFKA
ncbi:MAG: response regulator transcription factor [Bacteroidia bacterium]